MEKPAPAGFTYLEIAVVLMILAVFLSVSLLRIDTVFSGGDLRLASRMLSGKIAETRGEAAYARRPRTLGFDIDANRFYAVQPPRTGAPPVGKTADGGNAPEDATALPDGVRLEDVVVLGRGKTQQGEAEIRFFPDGTVEPSLIHLRSENGDAYTLEVQPLTGRLTVHDRYVEMRYAP